MKGGGQKPAPEEEIGSKAARGMGWVAVMRYANRITGFVTTLILARVVAPEAFGLIAVASMMLEVVNVMKDMGMGQALIYRKDALATASSTAFFVLAGVNLTMFVALCALSPYLASFLNEPRVTPVLIVMSFSLVLFGFRAVPDALLRKEMNFRRLLVPTIVPVILAAVVSIVMAFKGAGVWSLVARSLIVESLTTILIWRYCTFRPSFVFDRRIARELFSYGKYIIGASIVGVALYNVDKLIISKLDSVSALGLYIIAQTLASVPVGELGHLVCRVMFPALSKLNENAEKFRAGLRVSIEMSSIVSIPLGLGIIFFSQEIMHVLFKEEWWEAAPMLRILAGAAVLRSISVLLHEGAKAAGRPEFVQQALAIRFLIVSLAGIPVTTHFGTVGLCYVVLVAYTVGLIFEVFVTARQGNLEALSFGRILVYPVVSGTIAVACCYWVASLITSSGEAAHLAVGTVLSIATYCAATYKLRHDLVLQAYRAITS